MKSWSSAVSVTRLCPPNRTLIFIITHPQPKHTNAIRMDLIQVRPATLYRHPIMLLNDRHSICCHLAMPMSNVLPNSAGVLNGWVHTTVSYVIDFCAFLSPKVSESTLSLTLSVICRTQSVRLSRKLRTKALMLVLINMINDANSGSFWTRVTVVIEK